MSIDQRIAYHVNAARISYAIHQAVQAHVSTSTSTSDKDN